MSLIRNKKHEVIHWTIFVVFAIFVSGYLLNYTKIVEERLDEITETQLEMLDLLRVDEMSDI